MTGLLPLLPVLAACSSVPLGPGRGAPGASTAAPPSLAAEQRRLADLFRGTPVVFTLLPHGALSTEVPLGHCFDRGAVVVRRPLQAVLDRLAASAAVRAAASVETLAPSDAGRPNPALATERAAAVRDYLVAGGLMLVRFKPPRATTTEVVQVIVTP
ncbi:hypothetical protein [Aquabacterium sp. J223]|uniref:hypothetical protein n=1 Tax=Aquabacterium sp. J223 TaxID=2898431 RepID=UPI0021ADB7DE|nr:hypothetical protein [Aquabacterium sp. J223]UUX96304.1 hypothetical protein LRS07_02985 [Aquabacterium sp. J223]